MTNSIGLIVDTAILQADRFIFSPGPPTKTLEIDSAAVKALLDATEAEVQFLPENRAAINTDRQIY